MIDGSDIIAGAITSIIGFVLGAIFTAKIYVGGVKVRKLQPGEILVKDSYE